MNTMRPIILTCDDVPENLEFLGKILSPFYDIQVALHGAKALEIANRTPQPDLILLDIMMPGMDGYEVCRRLKANPATQKIPVIFVTAMSEDIDEARGFELGALDYLTKPVNPLVILARIKTHLSLQTALSELERQNTLLQENLRLREDVERITRHDLKNPVSAFINIPSLLAKDENLTPDQVEMLDLLSAAGRRTMEMINRSLDLYKMEQGTYELNPADVNVAEIIRQILGEFAPLIKAQKIAISLLKDGVQGSDHSVFLAKGEESLLYSMLSNLMKNALEASPRGGDIKISFLTNPEYAIAIHNEGEIPLEIRDRLFERYITHGKRGGTGLGVYSARLIARTLGGDLRFTSSKKAGTLFKATLPPTQKNLVVTTEFATGTRAKPRSELASWLRMIIPICGPS